MLRPRRRGVALLIALIAVVLSATISYSYLVTQDTAINIAGNVQTQARARAITEAGMEMAIAYVMNDTNWRTSRPNGTWVSNQSFGSGAYTIVGEDGEDTNGDGIVDGDGDLANNPAHKLTLTVTGTHGGSTSTVRAVVAPQINTKNVLCVVGNPSSLTAIDSSRQTLIESWGWSVTWADDGNSQSSLEAAADDASAVFVCDSASSLGTKLKATSTGVVLEDGGLCSSFGISSTSSTFTAADGNQLDILNNSHYITSPFSLGSLTTGPSSVLVEFPSGTYATDMVNLAERMSSSSRLLAAVESGGVLSDGSAAAGRRVFLPFGKMSASTLTSNGQSVLKRALEWADQSTGSVSFGYATKLGSSQKSVANKQVAVQVTLSQTGTLTGLVAYIKGSSSNSVRYAVYTDSSGQPGTLVAQTGTQTLGKTGWQWKRINFGSGVPLTAGTYWLALSFNSSSTYYRYSSSGGQMRYNNNNAISNGFSNTWGSSSTTSTRRMNIYGILTPESSGSEESGESATYYIDGSSVDWR